ncbi:MAG: hypothetical protein HQL35_03725 [Alphaproteobacteria bacterium]|nr:hypothetical protein [Alphaproteobacteria bacterium]
MLPDDYLRPKMRIWYKFTAAPHNIVNKDGKNPTKNDNDEFIRHATLMGGYNAEQNYDSRESFFERYLIQEGYGRTLFYDKFLRENLTSNMHILSIASGRAANELALIQDGFDVTCSDLKTPDCMTETRSLFGDIDYQEINVLNPPKKIGYDAVISLSLIYNFNDDDLKCFFSNISDTLHVNGILLLDYVAAPDNIWSFLLDNVYLPVEACAYAVFRTIKDRRLHTVTRTFHGYRRSNTEIEAAAANAGLELRAYAEGCYLVEFHRGYLLPKILGSSICKSVLSFIGRRMPYVRMGAFVRTRHFQPA